MAQAGHSIITRRSFVAATAAVVSSVAVTALPAQALEAAPDLILALIAAHKAAYTALDQACLRLSDLEHELPAERRKEWYPEDK